MAVRQDPQLLWQNTTTTCIVYMYTTIAGLGPSYIFHIHACLVIHVDVKRTCELSDIKMCTVLQFKFCKYMDLIFAGINMFWARLRLILA